MRTRKKARAIGSDRWGTIYRFGLYEDMDILQQEILAIEELKERLAKAAQVLVTNTSH